MIIEGVMPTTHLPAWGEELGVLGCALDVPVVRARERRAVSQSRILPRRGHALC